MVVFVVQHIDRYSCSHFCVYMVFAAALVLRGLYRSYLILPGEFSRSRSFRLPIDPIRPAYVCERAVLYRSHLRSMCERSRYFRSHPGKHVLDHADIFLIQDFPSEVNFMESKTRRQQYSTTSHGAYMCIESAQSKRGQRKGY